MNINHQIVVLGAGYTGMLAAIRLARRTRKLDVRITLINPSARFTERLRMHQVAAGHELPNYQIPELLAGTNIDFVQAWATTIDPAAQQITLDDGTTLPYDTLVYALGSTADTSIVPGAADHAWTLDKPSTAHEFSVRLAELAAVGGSVAVAGGGLTGIEAAAEIAENHPGLHVTLISNGEPGAMMGDKARAYLNRALDRLGVARKVGVAVTRVLPDAVELANGETIPAQLTLWTAGVRVSSLATKAGIATDARGLIAVDPTLRSISHPNIHAIGDAAAIQQAWGQIHGTCQSGMPSGAYTADVIASQLRSGAQRVGDGTGKTVQPFRFGYFHQPVSLGRRDAVIQFTTANDTPGRFHLTGRAAVFYKSTVSNSPVPTFKMSKKITLGGTLSKGGRATRVTA